MAWLEPINAEAEAGAHELLSKEIPRAPQSPEDQAILSIILQDVALAESQDRDWAKVNSWDENMRMYLFQVPTQRWEGSMVERSSMGVPLILEHVNAINNMLNEVLWEEDPPFHFVSLGKPTEMESRANAKLVEALLEKSGAKAAIKWIDHSGLLHGTGIGKAYWRKEHGYMCPTLEYLPRKDVYVSSNTKINDIRTANWKAHRAWYTPLQIDKWRGLPGYKNMPTLEGLKALGDPPKQPSNASENHRYTSMAGLTPEFDPPDPTEPDSVDPSHHPLEVIEYSNDNFVWTVLSRTVIIRVIDNRRGHAVRYFSTGLIPVEGQFDSIGLGKLLYNEQRLQQGLLNTSIDNLALSLLGMFKRRKGSSIFPNQINVRPGVVFDVDDTDDLEPVKFTPIDPTVFEQIQASDARSQRRSGANEVTVQGVFPQTSGGIGRTAEGMGALAQASSARIRAYVTVTEEQVIIPFLEFLVETAPKYLSKSYIRDLIGSELADHYKPTEFSKLKFKILTATKLKRRAAMLQSIPALLQYYMQEPIQESLKGQYMKVDHNEMNWLWTDATGYPVKGNLVIDMEEDEIQALLAENPMVQELVVNKARIQQETDAKIQIVDAENSGRAFRDIIKGAIDQNKIDQTVADQLMGMMGQQKANQDMDAAMAEVQPMGPMEPANVKPSGASGAAKESKGARITPY